jgi:hypothetical protein
MANRDKYYSDRCISEAVGVEFSACITEKDFREAKNFIPTQKALPTHAGNPGEKNGRWCGGYYYTPFGKFVTPHGHDFMSPAGMHGACKKNTRTIRAQTYANTKYLKELGSKDEIVGKTYKDLGFYYGK